MTIAATWTSKTRSGAGGSPVPNISHRGPDALRLTASVLQRDIRVRLRLFGGVSLHADKREIAIKNRKAKAMLAYLTLAPRMTETRDRLIALLWSESAEPQARASLRQLLSALRSFFDAEGLQGLSIDKAQVSLSPALFTNELDDLLASIVAGHPPDYILNQVRFAESFLYDCADVDPAFEHWLRIQRETVRQQLICALEEQLAAGSLAHARIKDIASALLQVDPAHELACVHLMRAHVETGNTAGALRAYKCLWEHLEQDYDIEPSTATQEFAVAIKLGICTAPVRA